MLQLRVWLASIGLAELIDRYCHFEQEPFGYEMENFRMGQICCAIALSAGAKDVKPDDFYPRLAAHKSIAKSVDNQLIDSLDHEGLLAMFRGMSHTAGYE